jgi:Concanavalin A-like lectin/glucanases superfamily
MRLIAIVGLVGAYGCGSGGPAALRAGVDASSDRDTGVCVASIPSLVAYWRADLDAKDSVGANDGTLEGGAHLSPGIADQAFDLDGVSAYVAVANTASMDFGTGDFSISLWVSFRALGGETTLIQKSAGVYPNDQTYQLEAFPDAVRLIIRDTTARENDYNAPKTLAPGQFHHIAATRNGSTIAIYVDGELVGSQSSAAVIDTGHGGTATLGRLASEAGAPFDRFLNGLLDEVQLYDRSLTPEEIGRLHTEVGLVTCAGG